METTARHLAGDVGSTPLNLEGLADKTSIILSGVPGSGKSTIAEWIKLRYPESGVVSADHHFIVDGVYRFNPRQLGAAHEACKTNYGAWCLSDSMIPCVVDNTNLNFGECKYYYESAVRHGFKVVVLSIVPQANMARSVHGLPPEAMARMVAKQKAGLPELSKLQGFRVVEQSVVDELYNQLQRKTK